MIEIKTPTECNPPPAFRWQPHNDGFKASLITDPSTSMAFARKVDTGQFRLTTVFTPDADDAEMCATMDEAKAALEKRWQDWIIRAKPALESARAWVRDQPIYASASFFKLGPHANSRSALCLAVARVKGVSGNPEVEMLSAVFRDLRSKHPRATLVDHTFTKVEV